MLNSFANDGAPLRFGPLTMREMDIRMGYVGISNTAIELRKAEATAKGALTLPGVPPAPPAPMTLTAQTLAISHEHLEATVLGYRFGAQSGKLAGFSFNAKATPHPRQANPGRAEPSPPSRTAAERHSR